jgi:hypothetical protein
MPGQYVDDVGATLDRLAPHVARSIDVPTAALERAFRPARRHDIPQLLALRRRVWTDAIWWDDEAFVRWRYFDRPSCPQPTYWVFERDGDLIAGVGTEPVALLIDGEPHGATRALDIMVDPAFDGRGLGAFMNLNLVARFPITLVTGTNNRSDNLVRRTWTHVTDLEAWKRPVRTAGMLSRSIGALGARALAPIADIVLRLDTARRRPRQQRGIEVRTLSDFSGVPDSLITSFAGAGRIVVRRDAQYLNWRFATNPRCRYRVFGAYDQGQFAAYVVARSDHARKGGRGEVVDWLAAGGKRACEALSVAFSAAFEWMSEAGATLVVGLSSPLAAGPLKERTYIRRAAERLPFLVRASSASLQARLLRGEDWYLTGSDFDGD